jgi:ABC-type multidrug transport system ATPase subunit
MTGLTTRHGSTAAVDGLDLHVEGGQVSDFLGRMGPGKSTTMPMLLELIRPTGGRAWVNGGRCRPGPAGPGEGDARGAGVLPVAEWAA